MNNKYSSDSKPENTLETKQKKKKKSNDLTNNTSNKVESNSKQQAKRKKNPKKKITEAKKNGGITESDPAVDGSKKFSFAEIANNKEASALIHDLVRCYTCNSNLPEQELDILKKTLYEKTVAAFICILNTTIAKLYNRLITSRFLERKNVPKKDAYCQTDISYMENC